MARSKPTDTAAPSGKAGRGPAGGGRRGSGAAASGKGATPTTRARRGREDKPKGVRARAKRFVEQLRMIKQAYTLTRQNDPRLPWLMLGAFLVPAAIIELIAIFALRQPYLYIVIAVLVGLLAAMILFGRRAQGSAYRQAEGQPGAAAWALENMRGDWRVTSGVAGTPQFDAVHRVLGRPGVILVGEGSPTRVRGLIAQEKRKLARVIGDTPIYDVLVGDGAGQVPLRKLSSHVTKLPRNLTGAELNALGKRMAALGGPRMPIPGGPLPGGRQMTVSQRQVRRR